MASVHNGHRERMKQKFINGGLSSFTEHEILEMLLFYSIPRKNTNEIAHDLINNFRNISGVFDANIELLENIDGISKHSAILLKMIPELCKVYLNSKLDLSKIKSFDDMKELAVNQYIGTDYEILKVIYLDSNCNYLNCVDICTLNNTSLLNVDIKKIIEQSEKFKSTHLIVVHNHPNGNPIPSSCDIVSTKQLEDILKKVNVSLVDHLIVANSEATSMRDLGYI